MLVEAGIGRTGPTLRNPLQGGLHCDLPMLIKSGRVILGLKKLKGKGKSSNM